MPITDVSQQFGYQVWVALVIPKVMVGITDTLIRVNDWFSQLAQPGILTSFVRHQYTTTERMLSPACIRSKP